MSRSKNDKMFATGVQALLHARQIPVEKSCISAIQLIGRVLKQSSSLSANQSSLNRLGFWGTLNLMVDGVKQSAVKIAGVGSNTVGAMTSQSTFTQMFSTFSASVGGIEQLAAVASSGIAIHTLSKKLAQSARNSRNNTKNYIEKLIATYTLGETAVLLILLIGAYVANIDRIGARENLQGLYILSVWIITIRDILFVKMYYPLITLLKRMASLKSLKTRLQKGIFCNELETLNVLTNTR